MNYKLAFALGLIPPGVVAKKPNYLTFTSPEPFTIHTSPGTGVISPIWYGTLYYSTDTINWYEWDDKTVISSALNGYAHCIFMRGVGNSSLAIDYQTRWRLSGKNIRCIGNIENLLNYEKVANGEHPYVRYPCITNLFHNNASLIEAPELPIIELPSSCYAATFKACPNLIKAPALPATIFGMNSCASMFENDTRLIAIPRLPATLSKENGSGCFSRMFSGCTSVKLSATQSEEYPTPYHIPAVEDDSSYFYEMFAGTGGTFTGTPEPDTTYYLHKSNSVVD